MRKADENRAENYIRKHSRFKKWIAFAVCLSLLSGTVTFYMLNKPATAMTEEGAKQVGLVLETADNAYEQGLIKQMENEEAKKSEDGEKTEESAGAQASGEDNSAAASSGSSAVAASSESSESKPEGASEGKSEAVATDASSTGSSEGASTGSSSGASTGSLSSAASDASSSASTGDSSSDTSSAAASASSAETSADASSESSSEETKVSDKDIKSDVKITVVYKDTNGEQIADSKELSITESFDLTKEVKSFEGYVFDKGTVDETQVVLITKKTASSKSGGNQDAASTASSDDEVQTYTYYQVTTASGETKDILEDTDLLLTYYKANTQTSFTASDLMVTVKAELSDPSALPEGVELKIAEISSRSEDYNYAAYMEALNDNADKIADKDAEEKQTYNEKNTLLYDIAFKLDGVEYQPKAGTVSISLSLNQNQLSDEIGAADADGVSVVHLPVKDEIMDNVNATSDATDIKASDINVEVVKGSDVDLSGDTDKVSFETDSFSAYALVYSEYGIVSWTGTEHMSARDIADALGDNTSFGAVAGTFESADNTDVESNIAVGTLKSVIEFGNSSTVFTHIQFDGYFITKNSTKDGTFKFGLYSQPYSDTSRNPSKIGNFNIEVKDGTGTVNLLQLFDQDTLQSNARLYVYEVDTKGNVVPDGETFVAADGTKYTVTYDVNDLPTEDDNDIVGSFSSSYVENNASGENLYNKLKHVDGNTVYIKNSDNSYTVYSYPNNSAGTTVQGAFPISVSNLLSTASEASRKFALLDDTKDVMVLNVIGTSDGFRKDLTKTIFQKFGISGDINNYLTSEGLTIGDKLCVINLDLTNCPEYKMEQFLVHTEKESGKTGEGWLELANQIIINPLQRNAANDLLPYTGTLVLDTVSGTFVAPEATVDINNGAVPGSVIAGYMIQRREIHKLTVRRYLDQQASMMINNVVDDTDNIKLKIDKYVDGILAKAEDTGKFSFMMVMLAKDCNGNYYWKPVTWDTRNEGSTVTFDINPWLLGMTYGSGDTKESQNASTYYFVIFENDPTGNYSKDNTAILAKIKYYKGGEVEPLYYRIDATESADLQNNPGTGYFNDAHRISSSKELEQFRNVAFYNETKGKSALRIHKMVVNDFGSGFVRDNTGTALLDNVTFRITNNSTKNYVVMKGFTGKADTKGEAIEYNSGKPTGKKYVVTYNRSAQWTISDLPAGTYVVEEVADGLTFTYDPYTNKSTYLTTTNLSRVTKYDVTVDKEGGNWLGTGGNNYRAVFSCDIPNHFDKAPTDVKVGYDDIPNASHTQTVQVCNYYSIPIGPIQITKNFTGGTWKEDMAFTFTMEGIGFSMKDSAGNPIDFSVNPELAQQPMPVGSSNGVASVTVTGKDAVNNVATVQFGAIPFRFEGTYLYKITEDSSGQIPGVSYDSRTYYVKIEVDKYYTKFEKSYTYDNMANPAKYTKDTTLAEDFYYLGGNVTYATDEAFKNVVATCKLRLGSNPDTVNPDKNAFIITYGSGDVTDVAFNNVLSGKLTVTKKWLEGSTGADISSKRTYLIVYVWQRVNGGEWTEYTSTELSASNKWTQTITNLPIYDAKGNRYEYTVKESDDYLATYRVTYKYNGKTIKGNDQSAVTVDGSKAKNTGYVMKLGSDGKDFGTVTIINEEVYSNTLPSTGGVGTAPFMIIGIMMAAAALIAGLFFGRRKKNVIG